MSHLTKWINPISQPKPHHYQHVTIFLSPLPICIPSLNFAEAHACDHTHIHKTSSKQISNSVPLMTVIFCHLVIMSTLVSHIFFIVLCLYDGIFYITWMSYWKKLFQWQCLFWMTDCFSKLNFVSLKKQVIPWIVMVTFGKTKVLCIRRTCCSAPFLGLQSLPLDIYHPYNFLCFFKCNVT
jgi:hypothetical protein